MTVWLQFTNQDNLYFSFISSIDVNEYKVILRNKYGTVNVYSKDEVIKLECK
jgi:hypothetical protein